MPRVIPFPPSDRSPSGDDARLGQAWAAFAADDARASAPACLEGRVLRAAQAALVEKRRADAERRRHHWLAGLSALAASVLAATAWGLAGTSLVSPTPTETTTATTERLTPASASTTTVQVARRSSAPVPMTNVEAGRLLDGAPRSLAARPLLEAVDNGLVRAAMVPRAKAFSAPIVVPAPIPRQAAKTPAAAPQSEEATALPGPLGGAPPAGTTTAPDAWTSRGFNGVFDPTSAHHAPTPPAAKPAEEPPPQD